ncbi:MAG: ABC transporter substrate-binding protein [Chloroflexota bacterium]|nr:ABC transporter substrate-binding protein [Chloroflexota bacterium]
MQTRPSLAPLIRARLLPSMAGVLVLMAAACAASGRVPQAAPPATESTGVLRILGSANEEYVRGVVRTFQEETGVRTTYERLSAGDALTRLRTESAAPAFSVWWGSSAENYIAADSEGLLAAYRPRGSTVLPRQYADPDGHWTGIYVGALGFAVNGPALAGRGLPEPTSWADLTNPIYRGLIALGHPATSGTGYAVLATILQMHGKSVDEGFAYARALHDNVAVYTREGATPAKLACKQVAIGIAFSHDIVRSLQDGCEGVRIVFPSEGTGYEIGAMALLKNAPEPELGKRFMDWAITPRAQELGPLFTAYQIPTHPDAKVPARALRLSAVKTIDYDFAWAGEHRQMLANRFSAVIMPIPSSPDLPK